MRPTVDSDMRWLWAAYRMGAWRELMDDGLSRDGFGERMIEIITAADHDWIIEARGNEGIRPVGLVLARVFGGGRCIEPHVDWLQWATPRNRVEGCAAFFKQIGRMFKVFVFPHEGDECRFWTWFAQRRMLTRGGQVVDFYAVGDHARLFYTRGP